MNPTTITQAVKRQVQGLKEASWHEHSGMGYFKASKGEFYRCISVQLEVPAQVWPIPKPARPKTVEEVVAEVVGGLGK